MKVLVIVFIVLMVVGLVWYLLEAMTLAYVLKHPETWRPEKRAEYGLPPLDTTKEGEK